MDEGKIKEWINTFRHVDVVVQLFSTVAIDATFFNKPIVNFNFDPGEKKLQDKIIKELNEEWVHFKPIYDSGAMFNAQTQDEIVEGVKWCLQNPNQQQKEREWIKHFVTQYPDGECGKRMANTIIDFIK
ncbi:MAG: hypothetical protein NTX03_01865 [Bacteroidetes bacterium]|nr:hypothetical protein [Bacteroidota bacterium]